MDGGSVSPLRGKRPSLVNDFYARLRAEVTAQMARLDLAVRDYERLAGILRAIDDLPPPRERRVALRKPADQFSRVLLGRRCAEELAGEGGERRRLA